MGKKILSLCISMILIMLHGCGSEMNVGNSSSKLTTSKLKGDFVFYVKDNSIYYTNCDDIVETKILSMFRKMIMEMIKFILNQLNQIVKLLQLILHPLFYQ